MLQVFLYLLSVFQSLHILPIQDYISIQLIPIGFSPWQYDCSSDFCSWMNILKCWFCVIPAFSHHRLAFFHDTSITQKFLIEFISLFLPCFDFFLCANCPNRGLLSTSPGAMAYLSAANDRRSFEATVRIDRRQVGSLQRPLESNPQ